LDFISGLQGIEQQTIRYFKIFARIGAATADCAGLAVLDADRSLGFVHFCHYATRHRLLRKSSRA
jgi:hypothetical protein